MGNFQNDQQRCQHQVRLLTALQQAHNRRALVEARRDNAVGRGLVIADPLPALPGRPSLDPVLVEDEILVETANAAQAEANLDGEYRPDPGGGQLLGGRVVRLIPTATRQRPVPDAVRLLRGQPTLQNVVGANHVVVLGGTDKGGSTPEGSDAGIGQRNSSTDGPLVIVVDTGIALAAGSRPDKWLEHVDAVDPTKDVDLLHPLGTSNPQLLDLGAGHGTFVAGVIRQVEPRATVKVIRALRTDGMGSELEVAEAILRAVTEFNRHFSATNDRRGILNLSLGFETIDEAEPVAMRLALDQVPDEVLVVAAAGNAKSGIKLWPAAFDRVLAVSSHRGDANKTPSAWSNFGNWIDFSAPGECVVSTFVAGTEMSKPVGAPPLLYDPHPDTFGGADPIAMWSGTSFAAPRVVGALANEWMANPNSSAAQVRRAVEQQGTKSNDHGFLL